MSDSEKLQMLLAAVKNLMEVKGRFHTQQAYTRLEEVMKKIS